MNLCSITNAAEPTSQRCRFIWLGQSRSDSRLSSSQRWWGIFHQDRDFDALRRLKNHQTPGVDDITTEHLKYGSSGLLDGSESKFSKVWETEAVPSDWVKGIVVIVSKKGNTSICWNNRGSTLRSTTSKLYLIIVLQRMSDGLEAQLWENQCGFHKNRSCIDQIYSLRSIIHKNLEYNLPLFINFVDFKAAFDSINRDFIWKAFSHYGLPW